ncbi:hypothetical protein MCAV_00600 [[Mycoplasma] cavipharyngis]|uniref:hypothetical protein n=1 Tax=[Mycoplasma] cavipharyngis TaxID=92757 RepID=UPI0037041FD4
MKNALCFKKSIKTIRKLEEIKIREKNFYSYSASEVFYLVIGFLNQKEKKWMTKFRIFLNLHHRIMVKMNDVFKDELDVELKNHCFCPKSLAKFVAAWWFLSIDNYHEDLILCDINKKWCHQHQLERWNYINFSITYAHRFLNYDSTNYYQKFNEQDLINGNHFNDILKNKFNFVINELKINHQNKKLIANFETIFLKKFYQKCRLNQNSSYYCQHYQSFDKSLQICLYNLLTNKEIDYLINEPIIDNQLLNDLIIFDRAYFERYDFLDNFKKYDDLIFNRLKHFLAENIIQSYAQKIFNVYIFVDLVFNGILEIEYLVKKLFPNARIYVTRINFLEVFLKKKDLKFDLVLLPKFLYEKIQINELKHNQLIVYELGKIKLNSHKYLVQFQTEILKFLLYNSHYLKTND